MEQTRICFDINTHIHRCWIWYLNQTFTFLVQTYHITISHTFETHFCLLQAGAPKLSRKSQKLIIGDNLSIWRGGIVLDVVWCYYHSLNLSYSQSVRLNPFLSVVSRSTLGSAAGTSRCSNLYLAISAPVGLLCKLTSSQHAASWWTGL